MSSRLCWNKSSCRIHGILVAACKRIVVLLEQFKDSRVGREKAKCYRVEKEKGFGKIRKQVKFVICFTQLEEAKEEPV